MTNSLILNVDDNDGARYAKTRILQSAGFEVVEANNGTDAIAAVKRGKVALVLLDVKLPDINGLEVCRRIKLDPDSAMVLVLQTSAALTGRADKIRGLEGGADRGRRTDRQRECAAAHAPDPERAARQRGAISPADRQHRGRVLDVLVAGARARIREPGLRGHVGPQPGHAGA